MIENNIVRIVWLSDIHFSEKYGNRTGIDDAKAQSLTALDTMIGKFLKVIGEYQTDVNHGAIDYVLISGDLAFSSVKGDYEQLDIQLIGRLKKILGDQTRFITVPGNHDVSWADSPFMRHYISTVWTMELKELKKKFPEQRRDFLENTEDYFTNMFKNYSLFFREAILPTLPPTQLKKSAGYNEGGLYGIIVDKARNIVFNLINSSWYALGTQFDKILMNEFMKEPYDLLKSQMENNPGKAKSSFKAAMEKLVLMKNITLEYGEQILGETIMPIKSIFDRLDEHVGSLVVTCFHHPTNWLQYHTKYNIDPVKNDDLFLNKLLARTQLLLTGHEHVPSTVLPEKLQEEVLHLKGGRFLQDDVFEKNEGENRFSILEIDTNRFSLKELKYCYDWDNKVWNLKKARGIDPDRNMVIPRTAYKYVATRKQGWIAKLLDARSLRNILEHSFLPEWGDDVLVQQDAPVKAYGLFRLERSGRVERYFLIPTGEPAGGKFFAEMMQRQIYAAEQDHCLDPVVALMQAVGTSKTLTIIAPDFLVDEQLEKEYIEERSIRETYSQIVKKADFVLNKAKYDFFRRFEMLSLAGKELIVNGLRFDFVRDLHISVQPIPFWKLDRYE